MKIYMLQAPSTMRKNMFISLLNHISYRHHQQIGMCSKKTKSDIAAQLQSTTANKLHPYRMEKGDDKRRLTYLSIMLRKR